jgi:hypothetical protein
MLNIAFIHYHLKPGGVTTVMRRQIDAVKDSCRTLVLTGEPPRGDFPADFVHVPGLAYTDPDRPAADPDRTAAAVCDAVSARWGAACDLVHVHNPTLAKNVDFLKILKSLQARGMKLFLQIHDFAEDGRPSVYFRDGYVEDCHYGVINSRDYAILLGSGLKEKGLHRIFNTVETEALPSNEPPSDRVLYPIRARRRKNIGEAILLSIFLPEKEIVSITLPPVSPVDLRSYMRWKDFVAQNRLPVQFDAGLGQDFDRLVRTAKYMITTSITEGFGFSFLEPWASGKFLWGRKLPQICSDFEERGVKLEHLYSELRVPLDWIGKDIFFKRWNACLQKNCMLFGISLDPQEVKERFGLLTGGGTLDFGLLDESFQKIVIHRVSNDLSARRRLISQNPFLADPGKSCLPESQIESLIAHNREAVKAVYSRSNYRATLLSIYDRVVRTPVRQRIDKRKLLAAFFDLKSFSLLKWCDDVE